jgi:hypothetical protein
MNYIRHIACSKNQLQTASEAIIEIKPPLSTTTCGLYSRRDCATKVGSKSGCISGALIFVSEIEINGLDEEESEMG